ncbi:hypothetical protein QFC21_000844 [Naganishia friedmannii]|uniref:Uncharacterized protein n=1 Tax=Naganishia friedmannii TaxID=89922 RepID=A0ACC2W6N0_9TREE|nr:hypothetical protein QFC21_000844 [Naganishia friedmannii]
MTDTFSPAALKKRRNAKGLQLSSQSLAPPPSLHAAATHHHHPPSSNAGGHRGGGMIHDALSEYINMNQATPTVASGSASGSLTRTRDGAEEEEEEEEEKIMTPTQASLAVPLPAPVPRVRVGKSRVSRKKPVDLDISRSLGVRKAPLHPVGGGSGGASGSDELGQQLEGMRVRDPALSSTTVTANPTTTAATTSRPITTKKKKPTSASTGPAKDREPAMEPGPFGDLRNDEFKVVGDLGAGAGGTVDKVVHVPTGTIMAKKLVLIDAKPAVRKQILRELQIMHGCASPFIVSFYGAFMREPHICICMEYMDRTSLDGMYKKHGAIDVPIVGKIAEAVLEGLTYLYDVHRIIHRGTYARRSGPSDSLWPPVLGLLDVRTCVIRRAGTDIKPSNILVNSRGAIKICDFGVSGELINSIANTFVGTSTYMSVSLWCSHPASGNYVYVSESTERTSSARADQPERIQGGNYSVKSDVWSLGISLIELAFGRFPFSNNDSPTNGSHGSSSNGDGNGNGGEDDSDLPDELRATAKASRAPPVLPSSSSGAANRPPPPAAGPNMSILDLLQYIVNEPAPRLTPPGKYPREAEVFVDDCLQKDPGLRKNPKQLLVTPEDLEVWAKGMA